MGNNAQHNDGISRTQWHGGLGIIYIHNSFCLLKEWSLLSVSLPFRWSSNRCKTFQVAIQNTDASHILFWF